MIELKYQYPYIDEEENPHYDLELHWAEDENGVKYKIMQKNSGIIFNYAIDQYKCGHKYVIVDEVVSE